ncbi:MAG: hypothetical protein RIT27_1919 [Pseudomonadota bacterium]|jgi:hypothetical protein
MTIAQTKVFLLSQAGDILELDSIDLKCSIGEIYLNVGF